MTTPLRTRMRQDLQLAGLAEGTQKTYLRAVKKFAAYFHEPPDQISEQEFRDYLLYLKNQRRCCRSSISGVCSPG